MSKLYVDQILPSSTDNVTFTQGGTSTLISPSYVGELKSFRIRRTTSKAFPFWNLSLPDQTLSSGTYPDYVDYLRSIRVETPTSTLIGTGVSCSSVTVTTPSTSLSLGTVIYFHTSNQFRTIVSNNTGTSHTVDDPLNASSQSCSIINFSSYSSTFIGTWSGTTFTLSNTAENMILLDALSEDAYYQGATVSTNVITPINNTNWMTLRWGTTDINITSFNPTVATRTITVASGSPSGTTIELYPHRIASSTDARHKQVEDSVLINNGMQVVNGLRLRDRIQGHMHTSAQLIAGRGAGGTGIDGSGSYQVYIINDYVGSPRTDSINGNPRTGQFTRPRGLGVYFYEYVGRVNI